MICQIRILCLLHTNNRRWVGKSTQYITYLHRKTSILSPGTNSDILETLLVFCLICITYALVLFVISRIIRNTISSVH